MRKFAIVAFLMMTCALFGEGVLTIFHAQDGHLAATENNQYTLTLYDVSRTVTYFTEGPDRRAGKMSLEKFLKEWNLGKGTSPKNEPNAGLVVIIEAEKHGKGAFSDIPMILSDPKYDKRHDRLTFKIRTLEKRERIPTGNLGEITLFMDTAHMGNN